MSEQQRPDLAASLLDAGRREVRPQTESLEARILAATGYAAAAASVAARPNLWARMLKVLGAKGVVGVSVAVLAVSGAAAIHYASAPATHVVAPAIVAKAPLEQPAPPAIVADPPPSIAVEDLPASATPIATAVVKRHVEESDTIGAETAAIEHARHSLTSGDARGALREVDAFQHKFPDAILAEEIAFLRVQSLDRAGLTAEARSSASAFVARYPSSPYAQRAAQIARGDVKETP